MEIHPREENVQQAKLKLEGCLLELSRSDLTEGEYLRVLGEVLASDIGSVAKYIIRKERHPRQPNKPGGIK